MTEIENMVTLHQAAWEFKVPYATLWRALQRQEIPFKNVGHIHVVDRTDVRRWVKSHPRPNRLNPDK